MIVFVYGGITYSEICAIIRKSKSVQNFKIIIGGTSVLTSEEFIDSLSRLPSNKNEAFEITGLNTFE